jgi:hypothetical protein
MGQAAHSVHELVVLARTLRLYARDAAFPDYRDKFLRAAAEVDEQIRLQCNVAPDDWPDPAEVERLHKSVNILA